MPEGSDAEEASKNREEWHEKVGEDDPEVLKQIYNLKEVKDGTSTTYKGEVNGHKVEIGVDRKLSPADESGEAHYYGTIDEVDTSESDAKELFDHFFEIKDAIRGDNLYAEMTAKTNTRERLPQIVQELLGKKEE